MVHPDPNLQSHELDESIQAAECDTIPTEGQPMRRQNLEAQTREARDRAREIKERAKDKANAMIGVRKGQAADALGDVSSALRQSAGNLQDKQHDVIGKYASQIADQVENFAGQLRNRDLNAIIRDAEDFARRRPEVFVGGAVLLGFALARFFKSSMPEKRSDESYYTQPNAEQTSIYSEPGVSSTTPETTYSIPPGEGI